MKNVFMSMLLLTSLSGCASITPGSVVLQVNLTTTEDADRYTVIHGGRYWPGLSPGYEFYDIPVMEQRSVWSRDISEGNPVDESVSFAGKDGQAVNADIGIGYQVNPDDQALISMVRKYGPNLSIVIDGRVRDSTRNSLNRCASTFTVEQIYGEQKGAILDCALKELQTEYNPNGLGITRLTLNSDIRLPASIKTAMESANAATQKAIQSRNEVDSTRAEGEKAVAAAQAQAEATRIRSEAEAAANKVLAESITPTLLELKRLEVQKAQAEKWNGQLPTTVLGGDSIPMIQLGK